MASPFTRHFLNDKIGIDITNKLPEDIPTSAVLKIAELYPLDEGSVIYQFNGTERSYIELFSFDLKEELIAPFEIIEESIALHFQFGKETINYTTDDGALIREIISNVFYAALNKVGKYKAKFKKGITNLMVISIAMDWAKEIFIDIPLLNQILLNLNGDSKEQNTALLRCRIDAKVKMYLNSFPNEDAFNTGKFNNLIEECIIDILEHYNIMLTIKMKEQWYEAKLFIDKNFHNIALSITMLAGLFKGDFTITERALRDNFKSGMGISIKKYIIQIRMAHAQRILRADKSISIAEVANQVGYEEGNFRNQYKAYYPLSAAEDLQREQNALC